MDKLKMHSFNLTEELLDILVKKVPHCFVETKNIKKEIIKSIDFDLLRQELSESIVEGLQERYSLNWPGKREALLTANAPIAKTLRPCREESVNFDSTENLFIEGDNLDALKLMQETYLGKIKMIYIDPPYNTGNDFIYEDDFAENTEEFLKKSNQKDEEGNRLVTNTESNGRFHSDWLSMMYPRLKLAKYLLKDDGVIFISIDENEIANLIKVTNEIFGSDSYLGELVRKTKSSTNDAENKFNYQQDYILIYTKGNFSFKGEQKDLANYKNTDNDPNGDWKSSDPSAKSGGESTYFEIRNPITGKIDLPPNGRYWGFSKNSLQKYIQTGKIKFKNKHSKNERGFIFKSYKKELKSFYKPFDSFLVTNNYLNQVATKELKSLEMNYFSYPKPVELLKTIINQSTHNNDIILDFFAGSATTAHAVMQLNSEDSGDRKFIMVQFPEVCDEKSEAFKAGYKNIAEIGKERIRRAGNKINEENALTALNLDIGFRVLKVDSSNMQDVYYNPDDYSQDLLSKMADNIKPDRTDEDLLFQVLLDWGVDLSLPVSKKKITGNDVFFVSDNALVACFVKKGEITEDFCKELTKYKPLRVVFRDSGFKDDSMKINVEQIFKLISPNTEIKTI